MLTTILAMIGIMHLNVEIIRELDLLPVGSGFFEPIRSTSDIPARKSFCGCRVVHTAKPLPRYISIR
jgi:hypothetical protein